MKPRANHKRAGFTLIELLIVAALLGVIVVKGSLILSTSTSMVSQETSRMMVEDQARSVLDKIARAVMASDRSSLAPILSPGSSNDINFQISLGVDNGEVVWGEPERIQLDGADMEQLVWSQNPGEADEMRSIWSKSVEPYLEGEIFNGIDDNGNGLVDELGLSFLVDGNQITVRLSLGRRSAEGVVSIRTMETVVTVRNNPLMP